MCLAGSEDHQAQRDSRQVHHLQTGAVTQRVRMRGPLLGALGSARGCSQVSVKQLLPGKCLRVLNGSWRELLGRAGSGSCVTCASAQAVDLGCSEGPGAASGQGQDVIPIFPSLPAVRSGVAPTSSSQTLRDSCTSEMAEEILPTLPLCSPVTGAHSLSSSLDFVLTPQSHPGLATET